MLRNRLGNRFGALPCVLAIWLILQLVPSLIAQTAGMGVLTGRIMDSSGNPGCERHRDGDERRQRPGTKRHDGEGWLL